MQTKFTYRHKKKYTINTALTENATIREILTLNKDYLYSRLGMYMRARLNLYLSVARENYIGRNYLNGADIHELMEMLGYEIEVSYELKPKEI